MAQAEEHSYGNSAEFSSMNNVIFPPSFSGTNYGSENNDNSNNIGEIVKKENNLKNDKNEIFSENDYGDYGRDKIFNVITNDSVEALETDKNSNEIENNMQNNDDSKYDNVEWTISKHDIKKIKSNLLSTINNDIKTVTNFEDNYRNEINKTINSQLFDDTISTPSKSVRNSPKNFKSNFNNDKYEKDENVVKRSVISSPPSAMSISFDTKNKNVKYNTNEKNEKSLKNVPSTGNSKNKYNKDNKDNSTVLTPPITFGIKGKTTEFTQKQIVNPFNNKETSDRKIPPKDNRYGEKPGQKYLPPGGVRKNKNPPVNETFSVSEINSFCEKTEYFEGNSLEFLSGLGSLSRPKTGFVPFEPKEKSIEKECSFGLEEHSSGTLLNDDSTVMMDNGGKE